MTALNRKARLVVVSALALMLTSCIAALLAHVAIDAVGDFALARDSYDGVAHDSRAALIVAVAGCMLAVALRVVSAVLDANGAERRRLGRAFRRLAPRRPALFIAATVGVTAALLIGMEGLDALIATGSVGDLSDALGGSIRLGLGIEIPLAAAVAWSAIRALRWLADAGDDLVRAIGALFSLRPRLQTVAFTPALARVTVSPLQTFHARRAGKRGPPLLHA